MANMRVQLFADNEVIHCGNLTLGEQKKEGTQISFKDKSRRYFVLRCLRQKFLTLSGYKNVKEYRTPSGNHHKTVEQIIVSQHDKVHSMKLPSKKHKFSNVMCIIQERQTLYLEAETIDDLTAWFDAFDDIFIRLGWKQPPPSPLPSPRSPPTHQAPELPPDCESGLPGSPTQNVPTPDGQSQSRRKVRSVPSRGSAFEMFQGGDESSLRHSSPPMNVHIPGSTASAFAFDRPRSTDLYPSSDSLPERRVDTDPDRYVNVKNALDRHAWLENTYPFGERVINVPNNGYVNLRGKNEGGQMVHPGPPPSLPPRPNLHKRGNTFPGTGVVAPHYEIPRSPRTSGHSEDGNEPDGASNELAPKISVTEAPPQAALHVQRTMFQHLRGDPDQALRKVSLPQPLNTGRMRRLGTVAPPPMCSPPESPVQIRKAGSHSNLAINLSSRPLPSPVHGDSFDVHTLRWEMGHNEGFPVVLKKSELPDALGLVRIADYVWIAGWKAGKSDIAKKLHVGDQLRQINEQIVVDPMVTNTLFATSAVNEILLIIRRLPHAKVRNLHRSSVTESWGLEIDGNRVLNVSKSGPAAEAKLTTRAQGAFSERLCDWIITEINGEPVSLLSKRDQVKNRMDNAGLEMALVIQPDDFIKKLNAELQKVKFAHEYFVGSD